MNRLVRRIATHRLDTLARRFNFREFPEKPVREESYKRDYKPGEEGEFGYKDKKEFPPEYEPWRFNYYGSGLMIAAFATFCLGIL
jgi:hypothetical protein